MVLFQVRNIVVHEVQCDRAAKRDDREGYLPEQRVLIIDESEHAHYSRQYEAQRDSVRQLPIALIGGIASILPFLDAEPHHDHPQPEQPETGRRKGLVKVIKHCLFPPSAPPLPSPQRYTAACQRGKTHDAKGTAPICRSSGWKRCVRHGSIGPGGSANGCRAGCRVCPGRFERFTFSGIDTPR